MTELVTNSSLYEVKLFSGGQSGPTEQCNSADLQKQTEAVRVSVSNHQSLRLERNQKPFSAHLRPGSLPISNPHRYLMRKVLFTMQKRKSSEVQQIGNMVSKVSLKFLTVIMFFKKCTGHDEQTEVGFIPVLLPSNREDSTGPVWMPSSAETKGEGLSCAQVPQWGSTGGRQEGYRSMGWKEHIELSLSLQMFCPLD